MLVGHLFQVIDRQGRIRTMQPHEGRADTVTVGLRRHALGLVDIRGRKDQTRVVGEPHTPPRGLIRPTRLEVVAMQPVQALEQLEEVVSMRSGQQCVG